MRKKYSSFGNKGILSNSNFIPLRKLMEPSRDITFLPLAFLLQFCAATGSLWRERKIGKVGKQQNVALKCFQVFAEYSFSMPTPTQFCFAGKGVYRASLGGKAAGRTEPAGRSD